MLPEKERNGAKKLLELLKTEELLALANTITNKRIFVQTRAGEFRYDCLIRQLVNYSTLTI